MLSLIKKAVNVALSCGFIYFAGEYLGATFFKDGFHEGVNKGCESANKAWKEAFNKVEEELDNE